jgi:hypothetical protein
MLLTMLLVRSMLVTAAATNCNSRRCYKCNRHRSCRSHGHCSNRAKVGQPQLFHLQQTRASSKLLLQLLSFSQDVPEMSSFRPRLKQSWID